jgi:nicotinate-nucleotide pyrophosphorylase (carboxylating)
VPLSDLARTIGDAARRARKDRPILLFIEAEVDSLDQLQQLLTLDRGVLDIILLDNMGPDILRSAVNLRMPPPPSPNSRLREVLVLKRSAPSPKPVWTAFSAGTLTHGASSLDVALDVVT